MEVLGRASSTNALIFFHQKVLDILEDLVPVKKKKGKAKHKMHRMRRLLWKRLAKARSSLKSAKSVHKLLTFYRKFGTWNPNLILTMIL